MVPSVNQSATNTKPIPPECYGRGERKAYISGGVFNIYRVSPRECFSCPVERRCLAQQRRMRSR
jgi:hypothetical protein